MNKIIKTFLIFFVLILFTPRVFAEEKPVEPDSLDLSDSIPVQTDDGLISINFLNVDINQVIKVLADITGKVILPADNLSGEITIISLEKVPANIVANILQSALLVKGYTIIEDTTVIKIVAVTETKQTSVAVNIGTSPNDITTQEIVITQVMPLKFASALKLKTILQPLIGQYGNLIANERTNTLIITDISSNIKRLASIIEQLEQKQPAEAQVKTFFLNYGSAETISNILNELSDTQDKGPAPVLTNDNTTTNLFEIYGTIQAYPDDETSSIVVASAPINFPAIEKLIKELDVFPPQAMIEVVLMDVTLDDDFNMGIEFSDATTPSLTTAGYQTSLANNGFKESTFHSLLGLATDAATQGFTYRILNSKQTTQALGFILKSQENSKVLSTPKILASNNKESSITVGQEIPIIESSTTDLTNNVTNTDFRYEDVGLTLKVTPRISRNDYVNLTVHAELKDLSAQTILNASVINKREADATVIVPDGHTVILGGLMRDNDSVVENKIPVLGDIPIIGVLFKQTTTALLKTELLIFLTPHIVKNTEDIQRITSSSNEKLETIKEVESVKELKSAVHNVVDYNREK